MKYKIGKSYKMKRQYELGLAFGSEIPKCRPIFFANKLTSHKNQMRMSVFWYRPTPLVVEAVPQIQYRRFWLTKTTSSIQSIHS